MSEIKNNSSANFEEAEKNPLQPLVVIVFFLITACIVIFTVIVVVHRYYLSEKMTENFFLGSLNCLYFYRVLKNSTKIYISRLMIHEIIKIRKTFTDECEAELPDDLADMILDDCSDFYKNPVYSLNTAPW